MPSFAAAAAVARAWFDCTPPAVINVSAPSARAAAPTNASLRTLLPPNPNAIASSRLMKRGDDVPRRAARRGIGSTNDGVETSGSMGNWPRSARSVAGVMGGIVRDPHFRFQSSDFRLVGGVTDLPI